MHQATILLPDISGYTCFLSKTELTHGTHIINELLEVVADSVQPDFTLLEIEGDALLTYANGRFAQPALVSICENAFRDFHYYLKVIERHSEINRIGGHHVCEFDEDRLDIVALQDKVAEWGFVYIELALSHASATHLVAGVLARIATQKREIWPEGGHS